MPKPKPKKVTTKKKIKASIELEEGTNTIVVDGKTYEVAVSLTESESGTISKLSQEDRETLLELHYEFKHWEDSNREALFELEKYLLPGIIGVLEVDLDTDEELVISSVKCVVQVDGYGVADHSDFSHSVITEFVEAALYQIDGYEFEIDVDSLIADTDEINEIDCRLTDDNEKIHSILDNYELTYEDRRDVFNGFLHGEFERVLDKVFN